MQSNSTEVPEDMDSSLATKCPDSCVFAVDGSKLLTEQGCTSEDTDSKTHELLPSKVPPLSQEQVDLNPTQCNSSEVSDSNAAEVIQSKVPQDLSQEQVALNPTQCNSSEIFDSNAAEVIQSKVPQDLSQEQVALNSMLSNSCDSCNDAEVIESKVPQDLSQEQVALNPTQRNSSEVSDSNAAEVIQSKVPQDLSPEQVSLNTMLSNSSEVSDSNAAEVMQSKVPQDLSQEQVALNSMLSNGSEVSDSNAAEVIESKVPQDLSQEQVALNTMQNNNSEGSDSNAAEVMQSKVHQALSLEQVILNTMQSNSSKVADSKSPEVTQSKAPGTHKQVTIKAPEGDSSKVSDPKAADVAPSKAPSSSKKPDAPSSSKKPDAPSSSKKPDAPSSSKKPDVTVIVTPDDKTAADSSSQPAVTAADHQLIVPEGNQTGLITRFISMLSRCWTPIRNLKVRLMSRSWSTAPADQLNRAPSDTELSVDNQIETSTYFNQEKLDNILADYKKKLSVLLVFPKPTKQYKVFCEVIPQSKFSQPSQAADSRDSINYCKEYTFDLIIIDATDKKLLNAKELCRNIRPHNPGTVIVALRQRNYLPWKHERLASFIAAGFNRDFFENHNHSACLDALICFEKDVDSMIQLRLLKGLYLAVENVQEVIEISNANHEIQCVNKSFERQFGYTLEEVKGKQWYELMVSDRNPMDHSMKIKQQLDHSNSWEGLSYIQKKSGEHVASTYHIIPLTEAGKVLQFVGIRKIFDSRATEQKGMSDSGSNQSGWPMATTLSSEAHSVSRRDRLLSLGATQSHSYSNVNLMTDVTIALASVKSHQCPPMVFQIIDRVIEMIRTGDRTPKVAAIIKEDDELITELLDGLMTTSIPTNVEEDMRGRRRSTYYPMSKSVSRMVTRHSDAGNVSISPLPPSMQNSAGEVRKLLDGVFSWNFNVIRLEELTNKRPLLYIGLKIFQTFDVYSFLSTDAATFKNWLDVIEHHYNAYNPYHNSTHAADVLQAAASMCRREKLEEIFDDMDVVSTLIAAAIHDLDHPGKTNSFLINSQHKLAILYNDVSVLENHHTALAFRLTFKDNTTNIFLKLEKDDYRVLRQQVIDMVLATDMTKHFDYLSRFNDTMRRPSVDVMPAGLGARVYPVEFRTIVKRMLIKCSDVSNPTRPIEACKVWADRIAEEYCRQTDEERARGLPVVMPVFDRGKCNIPKTQLSFMNLFIVNMMESWNDFCPCPEMMRNLENNFEYWQQLEPTTKEKVVRVVTN